MKIILDQGLPCSTVRLLGEAGINAIHVGEVGLATAKDEQILELAREQGRVVFTLDADFHAILARTRASSPSAVRIRIEGLRAGPLKAIIESVLRTCGDALRRGAVATVTERRIRVRTLPLP